MDWLLVKLIRYPRSGAAIAAVIVLVGGSLAWWLYIWQNPHRVFEDMLATALSTTSVTKVVRASSGSQRLEQYARLEMGTTNAADWLVTAAQSDSSVTSESIGTPATGFIRYTQIATGQKQAGNKPYDFSTVLNVWGEADGQTDPSLGHLFSQTLLDISNAPLPPIGNLPEPKRQELLDYMHAQQIFSPSYSGVKRVNVDRHAVYNYQVSVKLGAYVRMMQAFAHDLGISDLDTLDPSQYSTLPPVTMTLSVDRASHQLIAASYPASGFSQQYTDWGLSTPIAIPHADLTTTDLQRRIQALNADTHV